MWSPASGDEDSSVVHGRMRMPSRGESMALLISLFLSLSLRLRGVRIVDEQSSMRNRQASKQANHRVQSNRSTGRDHALSSNAPKHQTSAFPQCAVSAIMHPTLSSAHAARRLCRSLCARRPAHRRALRRAAAPRRRRAAPPCRTGSRPPCPARPPQRSVHRCLVLRRKKAAGPHGMAEPCLTCSTRSTCWMRRWSPRRRRGRLSEHHADTVCRLQEVWLVGCFCRRGWLSGSCSLVARRADSAASRCGRAGGTGTGGQRGQRARSEAVPS